MENGLLTDKELAERFRVSRYSLWRYRQDLMDPLPHYRVGRRRVLYDWEQVLKWAARQAKRALDSRRAWRASCRSVLPRVTHHALPNATADLVRWLVRKNRPRVERDRGLVPGP